MKKKRMILRRILNAAGLPQELDPQRFFAQWYGDDECLIEQHRGILCFDGSCIRLATAQGVLRVNGDSLTLEALTESRAKVTGRITALSLEGKS